jgi:rSAM-associated Gly-rich repeat protein
LNITTRTSFVGFLLALSALSVSSAAAPNVPADQSTIEVRLSRLSNVLRERANHLPDSAVAPDQRIALGWGDGSGRDWVNGRGGGGWADGYRGDWVNGRNWRNGWADGGSFLNRY